MVMYVMYSSFILIPIAADGSVAYRGYRQGDAFVEQRRNSRVDFDVEATLNCDGRVVAGKVENVSLKGMLLRTSRSLDVDAPVDIGLDLIGSKPPVHVEFPGTVVRMTDDSVGVQFGPIGLEAFTHLRNIVSLNAGDPDKIMAEFRDQVSAEAATSDAS